METRFWAGCILIGSIVSQLACCGMRGIQTIQFQQECGGYVKRAADANTVPMAEQELARVVLYLEEKNLTEGYTSVFYRTPNEDVGFWYRNLKSALEELRKIQPDATQLETSNVLIKLRETLLDRDDEKTSVTVPAGIEVYPYNKAFAYWTLLSLGTAIVAGLIRSRHQIR